MPPHGGARVSPIESGYIQLSRCNGVLAPAELGAINPYAVHDDGEATRQRHDRLFIPRRLAICIAQALSQDHLAERINMIWAAS